MRIWLMKITQQFDLLMVAVSLRSACLAHQTGLEAHVGVAHLALDLGLGGQGCHRVHHDHVNRAGTHQHVGNLQGLLASVGLGNEELGDVHPQLLGVLGVEGVLGVDEGAGAALLLGLGHHLQGERGLAGGFRAVDLHHPPLGQAAHAQGHVQAQGAGGDDLQVLDDAAVAHLHDGALAELLLDLGQGRAEGLALVVFHVVILCLNRIDYCIASRRSCIPLKT